MFFSQRAKNLCLAGLGGIVLFLVLLLGCTSEPTQPPTPISPLPTPTPFYDAPVSIAKSYAMMYRLSFTSGSVHITTSCKYDPGVFRVRLVDANHTIVASQTIETDIELPDIPTAGDVGFVYYTWDITPTETLTEEAQFFFQAEAGCDAYCFDGVTSFQCDFLITPCVTPADEPDWCFGGILTPTSDMYRAYVPYLIKGED